MAEKLRMGRGIAEFVVVVLGVMAALAGDNWREARQDAQTERVYLSRLAGEGVGEQAGDILPLNRRVARLTGHIPVMLPVDNPAPSLDDCARASIA